MRNSEATKRHILDTYIRLCIENGERNVTLKLLVKNVKCSQPCIYYHFNSLEELRGIAAIHSINYHLLSGGQDKFEYIWDSQTVEELYRGYIRLGGTEQKTPVLGYTANVGGEEKITMSHVSAMIKLQQEWLSNHVFTKNSGITKKDEYTLRLLRAAAFNMIILTLKYYHENLKDKMSKEQFARVMTEIIYNGFRKLWRKAKRGEFDYSPPKTDS